MHETRVAHSERAPAALYAQLNRRQSLRSRVGRPIRLVGAVKVGTYSTSNSLIGISVHPRPADGLCVARGAWLSGKIIDILAHS